MGVLAAPHAYLSWTASGLGESFGGYRVYARPTRAIAEPWSPKHLVFDLFNPPGRSRTLTEAHHTKVLMHRLGWRGASGQAARWTDGWDVSVTVLNATTGVEQKIGDAQLTNKVVVGDTHPWLVSDHRPYLNHPLERTNPASGSGQSRRITSQVFGRGLSVARVHADLAGREYDVDVDFFSMVGEDQLRYLRAAVHAGEQMCLHLPLGDRVLGVLEEPDRFDHTGDLYMRASFNLVETARPPTVAMIPAQINVPCGAILDGTADYITIADATALDPASSAFTVVVLFAPTTAGGSDWLLSKGNVGSAQGYGIGTTASANEAKFVAQGASATATLTGTDSDWFDGDPRGHVFLGSSSGIAQRFLVDGTLVDSDTVTHGAISNAVALVIGALNGGASAHCAGKAIAAAYWNRQLSTTEEAAAWHWLAGHPGYRMPYGPAVYVDGRHRLCHNGLGTTWKDLSDNHNHATLVSSPPIQGLVWPLDELELHG